MAPTERFIPPEPITTIWARPTTIVTAAPSITTWRLSTVAKDWVESDRAIASRISPIATADGPAITQPRSVAASDPAVVRAVPVALTATAVSSRSRAWSRVTAPRMIRPRPAWYQYWLTPTMTSALAIIARRAAPSTVPTTDTLPPDRIVPPSTGAANEVSSQSCPMAGDPTARRLTTRTAAKPASAPLAVCAPMTIRLTGKAEKRAATGLAPTARSRRPGTVRLTASHATAQATIDRMKMLGTSPIAPRPIKGRATPIFW